MVNIKYITLSFAFFLNLTNSVCLPIGVCYHIGLFSYKYSCDATNYMISWWSSDTQCTGTPEYTGNLNDQTELSYPNFARYWILDDCSPVCIDHVIFGLSHCTDYEDHATTLAAHPTGCIGISSDSSQEFGYFGINSMVGTCNDTSFSTIYYTSNDCSGTGFKTTATIGCGGWPGDGMESYTVTIDECYDKSIPSSDIHVQINGPIISNELNPIRNTPTPTQNPIMKEYNTTVRSIEQRTVSIAYLSNYWYCLAVMGVVFISVSCVLMICCPRKKPTPIATQSNRMPSNRVPSDSSLADV